jgi:predicted small secreted protein
MKPWILAVLLGLLCGLPQIYGLKNPEKYGRMAQKFPRSQPWGWFLMLLATCWFVYYVSIERVADFQNMKPYLYILFFGVGIGSCIFVKDFLGARGFAVVLLLLAKLIVDTFRWHDSAWRLVFITWAYLMVIAGIWITISPWRLRDFINWMTASTQRIKLFCSLKLAFGILLIILGLTAMR